MHQKEKIAIVGMSCRLPQCNNLEEFWSLLCNGKDGTSAPPEYRWLQRDYPKPIAGGCRNINAGFIPRKVDEFDASFFGISPKEAIFMDPQQRLLHELVWEGLEDAGIDPFSLRGTDGSVFTGFWTNDYKDILLQCGYDEFFRRYIGNSIGAAAAKISFLLGMTGPSISTESGCSSGMVAVHMACKSLLRGETSMSLACGVNLLLKPFDKDELPVMLSPEGRCKPFDSRADGFGRAEGGGVLVLKRLSDAINDGDRIWAVVRGSGVSQEGLSKSMGTPTVHSESLAMEIALKDAEIDPSQVSYVEAHGTGTVVGDPMEILAITKAYMSKERSEPLIIGSVKGNVGHTESTSGITGIIKVVLAMNHEQIPQQINFHDLNPAINLDVIPAEIPVNRKEWKRQVTKPRLADVSSFGITGTDAHVIIEETSVAKIRKDSAKSKRPLHLLKISAKTEEALNILMERFKSNLQNSNDSLANIAYTANIGRANFKYRVAITSHTKKDAVSCIENKSFFKGQDDLTVHPKKICFLFTGQGSQYPNMAEQLYKSSPAFQCHFDKCCNFLNDKYSINIKDVMWGKLSHEISRTIYSQTSLFCLEYALLKLWESWGVKADYVIGHSLGEYTAAVAAGILSVEEALMLVAERSKLIDQLPLGKMLVIKTDKTSVQSLLQSFSENCAGARLDYAAINSMDQTVLAGDSDAIMAFAKLCSEMGVKNVILEATHAFHSHHMDPILEKYRWVAETVNNGQSKCNYISGLKGELLNGSDINAEYWAQHTRQSVSFLKASQTAVKLGCSIFIEIGPQPVLSALTLMNNDLPLCCLPSLKRNEDEWKTLLSSVGQLYIQGCSIDWKEFDQPYPRKKVRLPHYPFIGKRYWPDVNSCGEEAIHPLIGGTLPNASSIKLFQSGINLKSLQYISDHVVGQNVIFPGAGYLEMCLAAGLASIESSSALIKKPVRPMVVKNLSIEAPLVLDESITCQMQTLVESPASHDNWNDIPVKIYHRKDVGSIAQWVKHAEATFSPMLSPEDHEIQSNLDLSFTKREFGNQENIQKVYKKLGIGGLVFGANFQSLNKQWKAEENGVERIVFKINTPNNEREMSSCVVHPITLDAILQAIMFVPLMNKSSTSWEKLNRKRIFVPVKIGKFVLLSMTPGINEDYFVHVLTRKSVKETGTLDKTAVLTDFDGNVKCIMSSVELVDTTARAMESVLKHQTNPMPDLWEETWDQKIGPQMFRIDLQKTVDTQFYSNKLRNEIMEQSDNPPKKVVELYHLLNERSYLYMVKALLECGWTPQLGSIFTTSKLMNQLNIQKEHSQYFDFLLNVLEEEGDLFKFSSTWEVQNMPPSLNEIQNRLNMPVEDFYNNNKVSALQRKIGEVLADIIQGKQSPLRVLFPDIGSDFSSEKDNSPAAVFYEEYLRISGIQHMAEQVLIDRINHIKASMLKNPGGILRILEVGAGTGSFTNLLLQVLENVGIEYEYTYTDISSSFFIPAEKKFGKSLKNMSFKKLNIEEDPLCQGFMPEYYDYICGYENLHATKDIGETLRNMKMLLRPYGKFDILETTKVNRYITYCWGLLSGYWRFQDFDLRRDHCTIDSQSWRKVFNENGFEVEQHFPVLMENHSLICTHRNDHYHANNNSLCSTISNPVERKKVWIILTAAPSRISDYIKGKLESVNRHAILMMCSEAADENLKDSGNRYVMSMKVNFNDELGFKAKLGIILDNWDNNLEGILYSLPLEKTLKTQEEILRPLFYLTKYLTIFEQEKHFPKPRILVLTEGNLAVDDDVSFEHFHTSTLWGFCRSLRNEITDLSCRCIDMSEVCVNDSDTEMKEVFQELFTDDKEQQVAFRRSKKFFPKISSWKPPAADTQDLVLPPSTNRFQLILPATKSISDLNFGPLNQNMLEGNEIEVQVKSTALNFRDVLSVLKPTSDFDNVNFIGLDFAGEVARVGHSTSKWKPGDCVFGWNVSNHALPSHVKVHEDHVIKVPDYMTFNEAVTLPAVFSTAYHCLMEVAKLKPGETVLIHTASGGVGLAAIEICKHVGAKVITTAGSNIKKRYLKSLGIKHVFHSRNTSYSDEIMKVTGGKGVDVVLNSLTSEGFKEATLFACAKGARFVEMSKMNIWQPDDVKKIRPDVEYTIIDISVASVDVRKHLLGKLHEYLVEKKITKPLPYVRFDAVNIRQALEYLQKAKHIGKVVCSMPKFKLDNGKLSVEAPMFNDRSSYLITGGLGGIGLLVCKWMVERGAKFIVLAGRSSPTPEALRKIAEIIGDKDVKVVAVKLDVGNYLELQHLLEKELIQMRFPPLKGVMHAAGMLADSLIVNQSWERLSLPFNAKIRGTLNLHELTKSMNLEFFVLFSSIVAVFGNSGQCNHAAGNQFEDTFAKYRRSIGLPATTINWGPWCEVGVATDVDFPGIRPISNLEGIAALELALKMHRTQTIVVNVESFLLFSKFLPQVSSCINEAHWKQSLLASSNSFISDAKPDQFWSLFESKNSPEEKEDFISLQVRNTIKFVLKLDEREDLQNHADFQKLGVDSLMFVEIRNSLQALFGDKISVNVSVIKDNSTVSQLAKALLKSIETSQNSQPQ